MWLTILYTLQILAAASADFIFTVELQSFTSSSPLQRTPLDNTCCVCCEDQVSRTCPSSCNATILVCPRDAGHDTNDNSCPQGALTLSSSPGTVTGTFPGPWMARTQIPITIFHYDEDSVTSFDIGTAASMRLIDFFLINELVLAPTTPPTPTLPTDFPGLFGLVLFYMSFQVECAPHFFGPDCGMMCEHRDDSLGHFTCNATTGLRVCLEGYRDVDSNCTECIPSQACSLVGGFCEEPGQCICRDGFSGENCSVLNGSTATLPPTSGFTTATIQATTTTMDINLIISSIGLPSVSTQSTVMLQSPSTPPSPSLMPSSALELPAATPTLRAVAVALSSTQSSAGAGLVTPSEVVSDSTAVVSVMVESSSVRALESFTVHVESSFASNTPALGSPSVLTALDSNSPESISYFKLESTVDGALGLGAESSPGVMQASSTTGVQGAGVVTPGVGPNQTEEGSSRLLYIIIGAVVGAVVVMLVGTGGFIIITVAATRRHQKRKAQRERQQRNERRFIDVIANVETTSKFASNTALNKTVSETDRYLDAAIRPRRDSTDTVISKTSTLPHPTYSTFQHEDSGIEAPAEDALYAIPFVVTNSRPHTPEQANVEGHEYAVLECQDLIEKEQKESRHEEVVMVNENELLESIERTMLQINEELQTEEAMIKEELHNKETMVSAEPGYSFIYADQISEGRSDDDSVLRNSSMSPVSLSN